MLKELCIAVAVTIIISSSSYAMAKEGCGGECTSCHTLTPQEATGLLKKIGGTVSSVRQSPARGLFELLVEKDGQKGVMQMTETGSVGILVRVFLRAYVREAWGLKISLSQPEVAKVLTGFGLTTTKFDVKNGNKGDLYERRVPRTPRALEFWKKLIQVFDGLDEKKFFMKT